MSQGWRIGALVSVTINLVLIGVALGGLLAGLRVTGAAPSVDLARPPMVSAPGFSARAFFEALPETDRREATIAARRAHTGAAPVFADVREARVEVQRVLAADDYDLDEALTAFERLFEAEHDMKMRGAEVTLRIASDLPPDVRRRAFIEATRRSHRGGRHFKDDRERRWRDREGTRQFTDETAPEPIEH